MAQFPRDRAWVTLYLVLAISSLCAPGGSSPHAAPGVENAATRPAKEGLDTETDVPSKIVELPPIPAKIDLASEPTLLLSWDGADAPSEIAFVAPYASSDVNVAGAGTTLKLSRKSAAIGLDKPASPIAEVALQASTVTWRWLHRLSESKPDAEVLRWMRHSRLILKHDGRMVAGIQFIKPQDITLVLAVSGGRVPCELEGKYLDLAPPSQPPAGWDIGDPARFKFVLLNSQDKKARFDVILDPFSKIISTSHRGQVVNSIGHVNDADLGIRRLQSEKTRIDAKVADLSNRPFSNELTGNSLKDEALRTRIREALKDAKDRQSSIPRDVEQQKQNAADWKARITTLESVAPFSVLVRVQGSGAIVGVVHLQPAPVSASAPARPR
jgi:hypothetical protein